MYIKQDKQPVFLRMVQCDFLLCFICFLFLFLRIGNVFFTGFGPMTIGAFFTLSLLTNLLGYSKDFVFKSKQPIPITISNVGLSVLIIGILFSILFWPGARNMVFAGTTTTVLSLVWIAVLSLSGSFDVHHFYNKVLLTKLITFSFLGSWILLTPSVELYKRVGRYRNDPVAVRLIQELSIHNNPQNQKAFSDYIKSKQ